MKVYLPVQSLIMFIISNHAFTLVGSPDGAIIRLNLAWMASRDEAESVLENLRGHEIYLDFPQGRSKPPRPVISLDTAIELANKYKVKYFAVSNVETPLMLLGIRSELSNEIELVPKIETEKGITNLRKIIEKTNVKLVMLDAEDLWADVKHDTPKFNLLKERCRKIGADMGITVLELHGVIFA